MFTQSSTLTASLFDLFLQHGRITHELTFQFDNKHLMVGRNLMRQEKNIIGNLTENKQGVEGE